MSASTLRKLSCGCYGVTLVLPPDIAEFAMKACHTRGFEDADVYLMCILNTAMFEEMETDPPPSPVGFDEWDDDIPF